MTEPIRVLPPELALKIAAGEVVERPSSAVKELIDNAVDAGAREISVDVREAGTKLIRVTDDGHGIAHDDLPLAFAGHATSKIRSLDDLERLGTLGFRGEALSSIAAVSRVELVTRAVNAEAGSRIVIEHGEERGVSVAGAPAGTRISVHDLFSNVPARRKFVRSLRAEAGQILTVVTHYALARPGIRFMLSTDGRTSFSSPGNGRLRDAVAAAYGAEVETALIEVSLHERGIRVFGCVSPPHISRSNRSAITVSANGRPIENRNLVFALQEAYRGYLMTGRHPIAAIHLEVDPSEMDANIHPSKREVRFLREREVLGALHRAVSGALLEARAQPRPEVQFFAVDEDTTERAVQAPALLDAGGSEPDDRALPVLRVFGQSGQTFIVAEGPTGIYMIDQHAAHERILFDLFDDRLLRGTVASQPLLEPAAVGLTPDQIEALDTHSQLLRSLGFGIEAFGENACLVRSVPVMPRGALSPQAVIDVLDELGTRAEATSIRDRALASLACRAAVKAGQTLDVQEMREIVAQLERTPRPQTCPHGRPTMIHLSNDQLEREFGRR